VVETGRRAYRSPLRAEQARATRRTIVEAARALFLERGYAGTTIDAVADRAGVSRKTVFTSVGGKAQLLKLAWDWALVGDDEPVPMIERPVVRRMMAATDAEELLDLWVPFVAEIASRIAGLHGVLVAAADVDEDAAAIQERSEQDRLEGGRGFVGGLQAIGGLRSGLSVDEAAQVATTLMDPLPYERLVLGAGWSSENYVVWLRRVARASFLDPPDA
jgi:AcrR family transcriptional regulator